MRSRMVLLLLLGLNLALAAWVIRLRRQAETQLAAHSGPSLQRPLTPNVQVKTNVVVRRQFFTWSEVESTDYPTYITNLRSIGCPELTIRDIIVADVNQLYGRKRSMITITNDLKWWQPDPYAGIVAFAEEKLRTLDAERRELLTGLLGSNWEIAYPPPTVAPLTGPILSALPADVQQAVQDIAARGQQKLQAYTESQEKVGRIPDRVELAKLRQQTRDELARVLTPEQLEEYQLRYSNTAAKLRADLHGFDATPDEFRAIFRQRDQIDSQIELMYSSDDPASIKRRQQLESQRDAALKQELGMERYVNYKVNQDATFRDAQAMAQQLKAPPEAVVPLYELNHASELERQRIKNDATLSSDDRLTALMNVQLEQEKTLRKILGDEAFDRYQKAKDTSTSTQ